ncbi:MAG: type I-C CRISPR-associated protein Cas8c/Csd1 [Armatimonadetes bacterium]|nr:type I-C CRISPR-associated protein Cas8c/Csd1 [Armatimonadota bacterium]
MGRRSHFLIESAQVVALYDGRDQNGQPRRVTGGKVQDKHKYFVKLLHEASTSMPELEHAARCLEDDHTLEAIRAALAERKAKPSDAVTLMIDDKFPVESPAWHDWWRQFRCDLNESLPRKKKASGRMMRCFITGEIVRPARTHPKVKLAAVGGQPSGSSLISFDEEAFCSGGLEQSNNYPVSEEAAAAYVAALNDLLEKGETLAGNKIAYWYAESVPDEDDMLSAVFGTQLFSPQQQELDALRRAGELLTAIRTGKRPDLAGNRYFAVTLSGNRGRAVVRDWMEGSFEELAASVVAWFSDLSIVAAGTGSVAKPPSFFAVLGSLLRPDQEMDQLPPPFAAKMWHVAVQNQPIPRSALAAAVRSIQTAVLTDKTIRPEAVGLIKAYHIRKVRFGRSEEGQVMQEHFKPHLNPDHPDPAYHCGRLMAVYAHLQQAALGDVGAGVVQRYYAAASATPALTLGRLARLSQAHLGKLSPQLAYWYEQRLADIWSRIRDRVPRVLDLEQQSLFALGYYQELADLRTKKSAEKSEGTPAENENQPADKSGGQD